MTPEERNWKLYEASSSRIDTFTKAGQEEDDKRDKWTMMLASGSFGLSFAFINQIVPLKEASYLPLLLSAWACFLAVLVIGLVGFLISGLLHTCLAEEESKNLQLRYEGKKPIYKNRSIAFDTNAALGYLSLLCFVGGSICLIIFIGKNIL
jgi:hypothetical protein